MGLLDDILDDESLGDVAELVGRNPQIVAACASLLSTREPAVGGSAGLGSLVQAFQKKGLGDVMSSWVGTGENETITPKKITNLLGDATLGQFAKRAGIPLNQAAPVLACLMPTMIDKLTPQGRMPGASSLESTLGGLISELGR